MVDASEIVSAFETAGYRLTGPRRALAGLIAAQARHFTADELLGESRRRRLGVTRATIFRSPTSRPMASASSVKRSMIATRSAWSGAQCAKAR